MIRFLADACLNEAIVDGCLRREPSMDFLGANSAHLEGVDDPDVLLLAASLGRILVTSDFATMPLYFADHLAAHGDSPGVILVSQRQPVGAVIVELLLICSATDEAEWRNRICDLRP